MNNNSWQGSIIGNNSDTREVVWVMSSVGECGMRVGSENLV